jgi:hypothetical protein
MGISVNYLSSLVASQGPSQGKVRLLATDQE